MDLSQRSSRLIARLRSRKWRSREGLVLVEGVRAAAAALDAGADTAFAVVSPKLTATPRGPALAARLEELGVETRSVSDARLDELADTRHPQGVLLVCAERTYPFDVERAGRYLVLDSVQDPGNAGTLMRAAAAFGLDAVVALGGTVDLWSAKAVRASAGLTFAMPCMKESAAGALERFRAVELPVLVARAEGRDVGTFEPLEGWALVLGNEGAGVGPELTAAASAEIAVPMSGPVESLNVAMAGSILMYALSRKGMRG